VDVARRRRLHALDPQRLETDLSPFLVHRNAKYLLYTARPTA